MRHAERGAARRRAAGVDRRRRDRAAGRRRARADRGRCARLVEDARAARARSARRRASARATFTWERTARETLDAARGRRRQRERVAPARRRCARSETLKAAGMAAATLANNAIALVFTVLFARLLGAEDYGSLAALVSTFLILAVPGSALQVAVAREIALGRLGDGRAAGGDARALATAAADRAASAVTAVAVLLREPIADLIVGRPRRGRRPRRCRPAACGCCCRSSAARCRACTPTSRSAWSIVLEAFGRLVFGAGAGRRRAGRDRRLPRHAAVDAGRPRSGCGGSRRRRLGAPARGARGASACATSSAAPGRPCSACSWSPCCRTST